MKKIVAVIVVLMVGFCVYQYKGYKVFTEKMDEVEKSYTSFAKEAGIPSNEFGASYDCRQWLTKKSTFFDYVVHTQGHRNDVHNFALGFSLREKSYIISDKSVPQTVFLNDEKSISSLSFREKRLSLIGDESISLSLVPDTENDAIELSRNPSGLMVLFGKYMSPSWVLSTLSDSVTFLFMDKPTVFLCNKEKCTFLLEGEEINPENVAKHINSLPKNHPIFQSSSVCDRMELESELKALKSKNDLLNFCRLQGYDTPLKDIVIANYERAIKSCQSFKSDVLPVMNRYLSQQ